MMDRIRIRKRPINLKTVRKCLGLTQAGLADLLGVTMMTVSRWERDATVPSALAWRQLNEIAKARGVNIESIEVRE